MKSKANQSQGLLLFHLSARQMFAMGTLKIRELIPYKPLNHLPNSHPAIKGTVAFRGHTIPVIDMAAAVGYRALTDDELKQSYIIVTDCQRMVIGFLVRAIDKIIECNWRDIESPPNNLGHNALLTGVTRFDNQLIQLLDLELLLAKIFPQHQSSLASVTDIQREQLKSMRILLVDDSSVARKQLSDALDALNIPYDVTSNGKQALEMMEQGAKSGRPVTLLVSDIEMPGLDGYELAFEVRDNPQLAKAYIILHTSLSSEISVSQAHQVGANEALTKFDAHELVQAMLRGAHQAAA
ncbi:chemotaxis protein CheW [Shewanella mangrovi]|uniref:Chemotaxis protein CheW n=1 Tax=Shewanella mangrovi TaxID=1515746 RepID=A0A094LPX9_9GAMM|nr:chemotaxis protein CheV [Shewanella mangrovi]KFZ37208.1 chemotaxis protein CheW [Shewanella mangrovi]